VVANIHVEVDCKNHDGHTVPYGVAVPLLVARKSK
jgi:hypothetical protein